MKRLVYVVFYILVLISLLFADKYEEAGYYDSIGKDTVQCGLCPFRCVLKPEESGHCRSRKNIGGKLFALSYNNLCAVHIDPIEKKPFFHFLPETTAFSVAAAGCNMRCKFCQNWQISQTTPLNTINSHYTPEECAALAKKMGCDAIAYTYTEPTNFYEYMYDTARLAKKAGIKNVYHSNGYINEKPLRELCRYLDAANIDLKGFTEEYYRDVCEADLETVLNTLKILKEEGVWLEITTLVVPGYNDDPDNLKEMFRWVKNNLGPDVPLHLSRFQPMYKLKNVSPTPLETLEKLYDIAKEEGINYVYVGNVPGNEKEDTYCPNCGKKIIDRAGYTISQFLISDDAQCRFCNHKIAGIWRK
ncbi:MAG: AmmeMemoRadiSam system radical SAM enzyme [Elusimicrobiota bacterium]